MKKVLLLLIVLLCTSLSYGQLAGIKTIPGDYATIAAAITDLNTAGVGGGGVTFNIAADYTEAITAPLLVTATGTSANPIVFQKSGIGANPLITRTDAGTVATSTLGGQGDAVWIFEGTDYATIDGISLGAGNMGIEYGYYIRKTSATNGCKNLTIKNCVITMTKGTSAYVAGIYSSNNDALSTVGSATGITVTSVDGRNENISILANNISNVFTGILVRGYNHAAVPYNFQDQNLVVGAAGMGNTVQNYAGNTASTAYGVYTIYQTGVNISYNTFNNAGGGGTNATALIYGVMVSNSNEGGVIVLNNNQITLGQGSVSGAQPIYVTPASTSITINYNQFSYGAFASTSTSYLIYCNSATNNFTVNNNQTVGTITKTGVGEFDFIYNNGSPTGGLANIQNNNFSNVTLTGASTSYGIRWTTSTTQNISIYNNTVSNITGGTNAVYGIYQGYGSAGSNVVANTVTGITSGGAVYGIYLGSTAPLGLICYENIVNNLASSGASSVYGIYNSTATNTSIYINKVYNLSSSNAGGSVYGIFVSGGTLVTIHTNQISDLRAPIANAAYPVAGLYISGGTTVNVYYNTVYLNAVSTGLLFGSTAIFASTTPVLDLRNNIFVNVSTPNGAAGYTSAYRRSSATLTSYAATSDFNDFYAGTPGSNKVIFIDGTNTDQTMAAFKTRVTPRDASSITENAPFVNVVTTPYDLHMNTTIPTSTESGGVQIATITNDFDYQARYPNAGYPNNLASPAFAPDMGADEFAGLNLDVTPPVISYQALLNTASTSARVLTTTITDGSGIPTTGPGLPVLYWKINSGSWNSSSGVWVSGSTYNFTFGSGVVLGDIISYYIVAQDGSASQNISVNPPAGASGLTANPPAASTPPTTPNSYTIVGSICGTFYIGPTGTYTTLTAAIADINSKEISCPITLLLQAGYVSTTETFPIVIQRNSGSSVINTLTIKPETGAVPTITGVSASGPLFRILNSNTIIDGSNTAGGTTRDLTITNTSATAPQVILAGSTGTNPLSNFVLKNNIIINGANTSSAIIVMDGNIAATPGYFNNIVIRNNSIQKAYIALYNYAVAVPGNGSGLLITGNDLNTSGANAVRSVGVYVQGADGAVISNNNIGNFANTADANIMAVWLATGTVNTTISGNIISNISGTSGLARGITVSSGVSSANIILDRNSISGITSTGGYQAYGIYVFSTTNGVTLSNNVVTGVLASNIGGYGARGINIATGLAASNITLVNNSVSDIKSTSDATATFFNAGIAVDLSTGGVNLYHNSVNLSGNYAGYAAATVSASLFIGTGAAALDLRDNNFVNTYDNTGGVGDISCAIYCSSPATSLSNINYNNYFVSGVPSVLGFLGLNVGTLPAWQALTGQDAASINMDPAFVSATDLHPTSALMNNLGTYLSAYPTDITGAIRTNPPDIGAYEFGTDPIVNTLAATGVTYAVATLNGTVNANSSVVATWFDYGTTTAYGSSVAGVPASVSGSVVTPIAGAISGLTGSTVYHYRARGVAGALTIYGPDLTFTTAITPPTVITNPATLITATGATLNGTVNAEGTSTTVTFEYGLTAAYGTSISATPGTVTGSSSTAVTGPITGLTPNTLYHFRAVGVNAGGTTNGLDLTFTTPAITATVVTNAATGVSSNGATLNGTVTANNATTTVTFEWGLTTSYGNIAAATPGTVNGMTPTSVVAIIGSLTPNTTYHFRVLGNNIAGAAAGGDLTFTTSAIQATVITDPATAITGISATLNGTVNANNATTTVTFEYGLTAAYGSSIAGTPGTVNGLANTAVSAGISGLLPNTTYHFRAVGVNIAGTTNGGDLTFTTSQIAPTVITNPATLVTTVSGRVNGSVIANNLSSAVSFEYGTTTSYGSTIAAIPATVNGMTNTAVYADITGLTVGTTYHYRVVATNGAGTSNGGDLTFLTGCPIPAAAGAISGPVNICKGIGGYVYSVPPIADAVSYVWTLPANATITSGSGTNTITVSYASNAASGTVSVYGTGSCGDGTPSSIPLTANDLPVPTVSGPLSVCVGSTGIVYSTEPGMTGYSWSVSPGGTITAGTGTNSITVTWSSTGSKTLTVNYNNSNGCTAVTPTQYNVIVNPLPVVSLAGPSSACASTAGTVYTTQAGMTNYVWTVSAGGTITAGGTSTSNTVTVTWNTPGAQSVTVNYNNASGCTAIAPTSYPVTVFARPTPTVTGPATVCISAGNVYTTQTGMTGYSWVVSAGGTITGGIGTSSITVSWTAAGAQTVSVNYNNVSGCNALTPVSYPVTVNALPVPTLSGPATACPGSTGNVYTTQAGMTNYVWTVSAGGTITAGGTSTSNTVTVTWITNGAKTVTVNYSNASGCSAITPASYAVTVNPAPNPTITGATSLCVNSGYYTYATEAGFSNYTWLLSPGGIINYGSGTNQITVSWNGSGAQTVTVNYNNASGCGATVPTTLNVTVNPPPSAASSITGTNAVCGGATGVAFSTAAISGAVAYVWSLPAGATIASGSGTNNITVDFAPDAASGNITVYGNNLCGNGAVSAPFAVTVTPIPGDAGTISGDATICAGETGVVYTVPTIPGASSYVWILPAGANITAGSGTSSITVDFAADAASGIISVFGTSSCGNGTASDLDITVTPIPEIPVVTLNGLDLSSSSAYGNQWYFTATAGGAGDPIVGATGQTHTAENTGWYWTVVTSNGCSSDTSNHVYVVMTGISNPVEGNINIFPVPNDGKFYISFAGTSNELTVRVVNNIGQMIFERNISTTNGNYTVDLRPAAPGIYSVIISDGNRQMIKKIVVK